MLMECEDSQGQPEVSHPILKSVYCFQIEKNRKYAKWKAAYIHNCLKNGETPHAGPLDEEEGGDQYLNDEFGLFA